VNLTAQRYCWTARATSWDDNRTLETCSAPERVQQAAAAAPVTSAVSDAQREAEKTFLQLIEDYRVAVEGLSKAQLATARLMTAKAQRSAASLLQDDRPLTSSQLPAFVNAAASLAAAAQHQWGKALGVNACWIGWRVRWRQ
jgi:formate dehydrogenase maturation protein FdhE